MKDFDSWLKTFRPSISDYSYYTNFEAIYGKIDTIRIELNILNTLVGSKNIQSDFEAIISRYPETLKCIPILLAVRKNEIAAQDENGCFLYNFDKANYPIEQYKVFMEKTGLFDLLSNHIISNLIDYVTGVETGLDSNGRKNRGGHLMENYVESFIKKAGYTKGINYFKEITIKEIESKYNVNLSCISNKGKTTKRFDFLVEKNSNLYLIETNFYSSGGSKLNETARSYKQIAQEISELEGVKFMWITDGGGWRSAKNNLRETCDILDSVYNLKDLENGVLEQL
ncbi:Type-2 restriction enzyme DpnII [Urinicoccus massiliensis]|uniref:Type-2 restriction enzyme n=1 Tax=Urinicoccus massiliensis TaxID=1723382 RepID=A0A8H2QYK6_9FIRM|nr:type II restriction endonuclease [Urinicoccus massiliensis]VFB17007.1 Type-2 restriction enzyme DpnII [Urinicoccus massiliensis]